jgi:hypothetical protein
LLLISHFLTTSEINESVKRVWERNVKLISSNWASLGGITLMRGFGGFLGSFEERIQKIGRETLMAGK